MKIFQLLIKSFLIVLLIAGGITATASLQQASAEEKRDVLDIGDPLRGFKKAATKDKEEAVTFAQKRLGQILGVMFGLLAALSVIPIVTGGLELITSAGSEEKVKKGKQSLYWGVIGLFLGLMGIGLYLWFIEFVLPGPLPGSK